MITGNPPANAARSSVRWIDAVDPADRGSYAAVWVNGQRRSGIASNPIPVPQAGRDGDVHALPCCGQFTRRRGE